MWWSEARPITRRGALGLLALGCAACGFTPVYGPQGAGAALNGAVEVAVGSGVHGFTLGQSLQERFGPPDRPRYRLSYTLRTTSERVAITTAQSTNRFNLIGRSNYQLVDKASGTVITSGTVDAFSSFSATGTSVATQAAQRDAYDRLAVILADKIASALLSDPRLGR